MENNQDIKEQKEYEILLADVKELEAQILPQLEKLGKELPEIYGEYANVVRETVNTALNILSLGERTTNNVQLAAEIGARTLEAYGAWKAAQKHNKMLDKFLATKKKYGELNLSKIEKGLSESNKILVKVKKLFTAYASTQYDLTGKDKETVERFSNLLIRNLILYRTNLFITRLCEYLKAEFLAWSNGTQTSSMPQTDYFIINEEILNNLFGKKHFNALEEAGDSEGVLSGAQIMLLADPQLSMYSLKDTICNINYNEASTTVKWLLWNNPGFHYYLDKISPLIDQMIEKPEKKILKNGLLCFAIVVLISIFIIPDRMWALNIVILSAIAIYRIIKVNSKKAMIYHVSNTIESAAQTDDEIESYCGKVNKVEIDYTRKDALSESFKAFFN